MIEDSILKEVRAIIQEPPSDGGSIIIGTPNSDSGVLITVDLARLIEAVYVAPSAPQWFTTLVEKVVDKYGINVPVRQSSLDSSPVY